MSILSQIQAFYCNELIKALSAILNIATDRITASYTNNQLSAHCLIQQDDRVTYLTIVDQEDHNILLGMSSFLVQSEAFGGAQIITGTTDVQTFIQYDVVAKLRQAFVDVAAKEYAAESGSTMQEYDGDTNNG